MFPVRPSGTCQEGCENHADHELLHDWTGRRLANPYGYSGIRSANHVTPTCDMPHWSTTIPELHCNVWVQSFAVPVQSRTQTRRYPS